MIHLNHILPLLIKTIICICSIGSEWLREKTVSEPWPGHSTVLHKSPYLTVLWVPISCVRDTSSSLVGCGAKMTDRFWTQQMQRLRITAPGLCFLQPHTFLILQKHFFRPLWSISHQTFLLPSAQPTPQDSEEEAVLVDGVGTFPGGWAQIRPMAEPAEPKACTLQRNLAQRG